MSTEIDASDSSRQLHKGGADWKFALMGGLATKSARRIFTAPDLLDFVREYRPTASPNTARVACEMLVSAGALRRVSSGVFLNKRSTPPAEIDEVAHLIRAGAVISLSSVLGRCGFLNNIADQVVTAVLPSSTSKRPKLGQVVTSSGDHLRFFGLAEKFFPTNSEERFAMLQPGAQCQTFRPEAALLQWLHLAGTDRSKLTAPPVDVDLSTLDSELLGELAARWGLTASLKGWQLTAEKAHFGDELEAPIAPSSIDPEAIDRAAEARERMMSRRLR